MKAQHLRIGNFLRYTAHHYLKEERRGKVFRVIPDDIVFLSDTGNVPFVEPIPLTPEIFEKCGFKKSKYDESYLFLNNDGSIVIETDGSIAVGDDPSKIGWASAAQVCSFLHQLQNLYFALTGQELEVKL